jgi:putative tryptophan/tyrosine transport system substrate-binding protein
MRRAKLPVFSFNSPQVNQGAHIVLSRDYHDGGRESALLAAPIMQGEDPARIPFKPTTRTRLLINTTAARSAGLTIPKAVLERADELINSR